MTYSYLAARDAVPQMQLIPTPGQMGAMPVALPVMSSTNEGGMPLPHMAPVAAAPTTISMISMPGSTQLASMTSMAAIAAAPMVMTTTPTMISTTPSSTSANEIGYQEHQYQQQQEQHQDPSDAFDPDSLLAKVFDNSVPTPSPDTTPTPESQLNPKEGNLYVCDLWINQCGVGLSVCPFKTDKACNLQVHKCINHRGLQNIKWSRLFLYGYPVLCEFCPPAFPGSEFDSKGNRVLFRNALDRFLHAVEHHLTFYTSYCCLCERIWCNLTVTVSGVHKKNHHSSDSDYKHRVFDVWQEVINEVKEHGDQFDVHKYMAKKGTPTGNLKRDRRNKLFQIGFGALFCIPGYDPLSPVDGATIVKGYESLSMPKIMFSVDDNDDYNNDDDDDFDGNGRRTIRPGNVNDTWWLKWTGAREEYPVEPEGVTQKRGGGKIGVKRGRGRPKGTGGGEKKKRESSNDHS